MKLEIKILPGEYTYREAVKLIRGTGQYLVSEWDEVRRSTLMQTIRDGLLPEGEYWVDDGEEPELDSLHYFYPMPVLDYGAGYKYSNQVCKIAVFTDKSSYINYQHYGDKVTT